MLTTPIRRALCAAVVCTLAFPFAVEAGGIIFKEGFVIRGKVKRENDTILDPSTGAQIQVGVGSWAIDDGVRRVIFSLKQVQDVLEDDKDPGSGDLVVLTQPFVRMNGASEVKWINEIKEMKPFDEKWNREIKIELPIPGKTETVKTETVRQALVYLSPFAAVVNSRGHAFGSTYLTRELGPETVRTLLYNHPDMRDKSRTDIKKRLAIARFLRQAGWYEQADKELDLMLKDMPGNAKEIGEAKTALQGLKAEQLLGDIERAMKSGRHDWARTQMDKFPTDWADDKQKAQLRNLKAKSESAREALKSAQRYLKEVLTRVTPGGDGKVFEEAVNSIEAELDPDNAVRLEQFVKFAEQDERERKKTGIKPKYTPEQLLSLAVSGWLLGSAAADDKPEVALKLWRTRQFVLEYQKSTIAARERLLRNYEKEGAVAFDELAQLITTLPPPEPEEKVPSGVTEMEAKQPGRRKGIPYLLQTPPEYHVGRPYPVLFVLGQSDEKPKVMLERFSELATQYGYLLVAPDWGGSLGKPYGYSTEEQAAVYDVLRDLQRRFNVDTDRVFMAGYGEGGVMAFDVGLSRPDLFAGVMTFAAAPRLFSIKYGTNAAQLPFYVVSGNMQGRISNGADGDPSKQIKREFDIWLTRNYPCLWVEYRGRALEWFDGEVPMVFDWMAHQKRRNGTPETGDCQTHRVTDNRFYWLGVDGIASSRLNSTSGFNHFSQPAMVQGSIGVGNTISVHAQGVKTVTIWLGRHMVDLEKPVTIMLNVQARIVSKKMTPNLGTLLDDFALRGDRLRLYPVKVELTP